MPAVNQYKTVYTRAVTYTNGSQIRINNSILIKLIKYAEIYAKAINYHVILTNL